MLITIIMSSNTVLLWSGLSGEDILQEWLRCNPSIQRTTIKQSTLQH